ncbi:hypothetical protein TRVA0_001S00254 [Trichomonascus vanleenenianus]|uniref:uncharacterized protein n=1 Tax=Trichomonascus vanleenenianus TaxID=2268995 RepID=UPI003EC9D960
MDAQELRERRQARIKAGGASRLAKITKTTNPEAEDYKPPVTMEKQAEAEPTSTGSQPEPAKEGAANAIATHHEHDDPPTSEIPEDHLPKLDEEFANDPLFQMLNQMQTGNVNENPFEALQALSTMFGGGNESTTGDESQPFVQQKPQEKRVSGSEVFWALAHTIAMVTLSIYVTLVDAGSSIVPKFCLVELVLHSTHFLLERGRPAQHSKIAALAQYIPDPFRSYILVASQYYHFGVQLIRDVTMCIFIIGLTTLL